jgi:hypothetical protein
MLIYCSGRDSADYIHAAVQRRSDDSPLGMDIFNYHIRKKQGSIVGVLGFGQDCITVTAP